MNSKPFFGGMKKQNQGGNADDLISEELPNAARKPNLGSKPRFALKPGGMKASGPPMQTPQKLYGQNGSEHGGEDMDGMDNGISPPPVGYPPNPDNSRTPPPHPNTGVTGVRQFSKPMKITKKKFNMGGPADANQFQNKMNQPSPSANRNDNNSFLNTPAYDDQEDRGLSSSASKASGLHREGSAQRIVPDKQLGPQIMKKKVMEGSAYQNSPFRQGGRPPSNALNRSNANSALKAKTPYGDQPSMTDGNYSDEDFQSNNQTQGPEEDQEMDRMRAAMAKENVFSNQYNQNRGPQAPKRNENLFKQPQSNLNPLSQEKNLGGFSKQKGLVMGERIDHSAMGNQEKRAKELRSLIQLSQEECFNMFEMVPQSQMDSYFKRLSTGVISTQVQSTMDDYVDQDTQTEDIGNNHKFNQAPDDLMINYNRDKNTYVRKKKRDNEALNLEKFVNKAGPVMEKMVEENQTFFFMDNTQLAAKRNAVELNQEIKFPSDILYLFAGDDGQPAQLLRITSIHMFESAPQYKCSISYTLQKSDGEHVFIAIVYNTVTKNQFEISSICQCEQEITSMCTSGNSDILILATIIGSLHLYDLRNIENSINPNKYNHLALLQKKVPNFNDLDPEKRKGPIQHYQMKYRFRGYTFQTDGLPEHPHTARIQKLVFISKLASGMSQIGALDVYGTVSVWSVVEVTNEIVSEQDFNICLGGKYKLVLSFSENLFDNDQVMEVMPGIPVDFGGKKVRTDPIDTIGQTMELEFDPTDSFTFFFATSDTGLFRVDKKDKNNEPVKLDTIGLNAPTALSMSDKGLLLAAFSCGSICMYDKAYTAPISVWWQKCTSPISQIRWCMLYFEDDGSKAGDKIAAAASSIENTNFTTRISEFFVIDQNENFQIWNLQKSTTKPAHVIHFSEKHESSEQKSLYKISHTCSDQSFFSGFPLANNTGTVNLYLMNFKKGSSITKDKIYQENKKCMKIIRNLPSNVMSQAAIDIEMQTLFAMAADQ